MRNALATLCLGLATLLTLAPAGQAQDGPLRIEITDGVIEPLPFAAPAFIADTPAASQYAADIARVIAADLVGSGLFREIPEVSYISGLSDFDAAVNYTDWKAINAQALIAGAVNLSGDRLTVRFRAYDVFAGQELGSGLQLSGTTDGWRRIAHKVADTIYSRLTGEGGYFDSRVVFVSETGPKDDRKKRLAIMDYDGANVQYLTNSNDIVLAPRFSPTGDRVLYTSYESGFPQIHVLDVGKVQRRVLSTNDAAMTFSPRFAPNGTTIVYSQSEGGNSDLYTMNINSGQSQRLTSAPSIETAPSFSPDGSQIVFESDRSGASQLYVMASSGGEAKRISFGQGRYGTPVWSPRGDYIAFTKQNAGRFHIGVMRTDGSEERLLTASFLDEGPTWSPNGRVIMFTRETQGAAGQARLYSVDVSGRNLKPVKTPDGASDPSWSPLQN
ncbi:Tol-Pal system beta propeller repeat protein TolB [Tritonibacter horizontis]|uniref:Tol-Pal system protein TolB n=1 Tax=Tritonibacter horizontis TaxID=1768241 RepID=A0A132BVQ7_9RHOB|nr:Tol-Pal system beta propeller repeat protein TolB [Tritonibacter horizontis]KUP92374.1 protein TolB [Tritonibacter horizontis]